MFVRPIIDWYEETIACSIETPASTRIAVISSRGKLPIFSRELAPLTFDMTDPHGRPLFTFIKHSRTFAETVLLQDLRGCEIGRLQQTGPLWRRFFAHRMAMILAIGGHQVATTSVRNRGYRRYHGSQEPIHDMAGAEIARVTCELLDTAWLGNPFFNFRLDARPTPIPLLLLATAFSHYIYSRLSHPPSPVMPRRF